MAEYIAKMTGSFGCVVMSTQCDGEQNTIVLQSIKKTNGGSIFNFESSVDPSMWSPGDFESKSQ